MYTTKTPIDKCHFNVTQLKEFFTFSVKDRYQLNYFICIKDFNAQTMTSLKSQSSTLAVVRWPTASEN
jgi:hypothetical protein